MNSPLLNENDWLGEFIFPQEPERRFSGHLKYSPTSGIKLEYFFNSHQRPEKIKLDYLFGTLKTGEKCTLIGSSFFDHDELALHSTSTSGVADFAFLIIGTHCLSPFQIESISFSLTNLDNFFYPQGSSDSIKHFKKPIFEIIKPNITYSLLTNTKTKYFTGEISSQIFSNSAEADSDLDNAFKVIKEKHKNTNFFLKKDLFLIFEIKPKEFIGLRDALIKISEIANLFAILINRPVLPKLIRAKNVGQLDHKNDLAIYTNVTIDPKTLEIALNNISYHSAPLNGGNIDAQYVISKWLDLEEKNLSIISAIQGNTNSYDKYSLHGETVLLGAQLESINKIFKGPAKSKYELPIQRLASKELVGSLRKNLALDETERIGKSFGDLRDELAHFNKPKVRLKKMDDMQLLITVLNIQLVVISYSLYELKIPIELIHNYQNEFIFT